MNFKLLLLFLWTLVGVFTFVSGKVSMFGYGCIWIALIMELLEQYREERKRR